MTLGRDGVAGLVCLAGSLVLLGATRGLPTPALVPIGPGFYPTILFALMAVLSAGLVVSDLWLGSRRQAAASVRYRLVVMTFAIFTAYVFLLPVLGYRVATVIFVAAMQAVLDPPRSARRWLVVVAVAVGTTLVTYAVFDNYLSVLLPRGRVTGF